MYDTTDIIVAQQQNFSSLDHANAAGYFRPWQLKRRELKPDGSESRASLFDAVAPDDLDDFERGLYSSSPDLVWIGDSIGTNRRKLYHTSQTKPYHATERTRAVWTYQDVFVGDWKRYRYLDHGRWYNVEASVYRDGLNETKIKDHLLGRERYQVYTGRYTRFVAAKVQRDAAERVLARAEEIKERLCAKKWFCQVSAEGVTIYWVFRFRTKTEYVTARLRQCLDGISAIIGPTAKVAIDLPLIRGCLTFVNRLLPTVLSRQGPEEDIVGFADWIMGEAGNSTPADVTAACQRQWEDHYQRDLLSIAVQFDQDARNGQQGEQRQDKDDNQRDLLSIAVQFDQDARNGQQEEQRQGEDHYQRDLLSIAVQFDQDAPGSGQQREQGQGEDHYQRDLLSIAVQFDQSSLKNRFWRVITGFFQGRESLPLNTALLLGARILDFEAVAADAAESILLSYSRCIPNPTSSRLVDPAKHHALEKDIRRAVEAVYQNNGRQHDAETSTKKMRAVVAAWRSKGLIFSDTTTWGLTYGYAAVPRVEFTDQERQNIRAYLLPVLSSRDTKGREPLEMAVKLADCIVRLVSAKEKQGTGISTSYLQQYIKGETGICCENKTKFGKIKEALIALGFIKVLRQGRQGCGATYYGLAGRLAEHEQPSENRTPVNEDLLDTIIRPIEEQVEEEDHYQMDLLSIAVQFDQDDGNGQQREQRQGEDGYQRDLLSIAVQFPQADHGHGQQGEQRQGEDHYQMDLLSIAVQFPEPRPPRALRMTSDPVFNRLLARGLEPQEPRFGDGFAGDPVLDEGLVELWAME